MPLRHWQGLVTCCFVDLRCIIHLEEKYKYLSFTTMWSNLKNMNSYIVWETPNENVETKKYKISQPYDRGRFSHLFAMWKLWWFNTPRFTKLACDLVLAHYLKPLEWQSTNERALIEPTNYFATWWLWIMLQQPLVMKNNLRLLIQWALEIYT